MAGLGDTEDAPQGGGHGRDEDGGHVPALLKEAIDFLAVRRGATCIDATVGLGGHSYELARRLGAAGRLIVLDRDPWALEAARRRLGNPPPGMHGDWPEIRFFHSPFSRLEELVTGGSADALLADLGLSSMQLADAERGFSFQAEGRLDMRMDPQDERTAEQVVNRLDEKTLADVIYEFGEERRSRRIARAIVRARPIHTTGELAHIVSAAARPMKSERIHPATRTFQALRIFVNRELEELRALLEVAPRLLKPGGRLVLISFHSLEDRMVKDALRESAHHRTWKVLTKKPVTATAAEIERNPRSRSAKLRAAEKI